MFKKSLIILGIVLLSGASAVFVERYLFPRLAQTKFFSRYDFIKKSVEDVTVINKTEQIYIKEETSINKITGQVSSSVVNIISYPDPSAKAESLPGVKNGTGLIVTSDGLIMTYFSAVNPAYSKYKVLTSNGGVFDAELFGIDSWSNLVFLKINASNLPAASFGDSKNSSAGEKIIVVGNGGTEYQNNYASGLLSGFNPAFNLGGKALSVSEKLEGVFETDFNGSVSYAGGPVVDYSGQIIGLSGVIEKDNVKKHFIIPSDKVKLVMARALEKSLSENYTLGIYYIPVSKTYALANNLKVEKGALIYSPSGQSGLAILAGSPAQKAGLQLGDIITKVNGEEVAAEKSLPDLLYARKKGEEIELTILRGEEELKIKIGF